MARGYYGMPGGAELLNNVVVKQYAKNLQRVSQAQSLSPFQGFVVFLLGLPFLPIWTAICYLITKFKIARWEEEYPVEVRELYVHLMWYKVWFWCGVIMYWTFYVLYT